MKAFLKYLKNLVIFLLFISIVSCDSKIDLNNYLQGGVWCNYLEPLKSDEFCIEFLKNDVQIYLRKDKSIIAEPSPYKISEIDEESQSITWGFVNKPEEVVEFFIISYDTMKFKRTDGKEIYYARDKVIIKDRNENKKKSFPEGVSSACFCADYLNGANSYGQTSSQKQKCNKMYICLANAMKDCIGGTSNIWSRSDC